MMGKNKFADDTKLERVADTTEGHVVIQGDPEWQKKEVDRNFMKLNKSKKSCT